MYIYIYIHRHLSRRLERLNNEVWREQLALKKTRRQRVNEVVSRSQTLSVALSQNTCTRYLSSLTIVPHRIGANGPAPLTDDGWHLEKVVPKYAEPSSRPALCILETSFYLFSGATICRPRIRMPTDGFSYREMVRYLFFCPVARDLEQLNARGFKFLEIFRICVEIRRWWYHRREILLEELFH